MKKMFLLLFVCINAYSSDAYYGNFLDFAQNLVRRMQGEPVIRRSARGLLLPLPPLTESGSSETSNHEELRNEEIPQDDLTSIFPTETIERIAHAANAQNALSSVSRYYRQVVEPIRLLTIPLNELTKRNLGFWRNKRKNRALTIVLDHNNTFTAEHVRLLELYFPNLRSLTIRARGTGLARFDFAALAASPLASSLEELAIRRVNSTENSFTINNFNKFKNLKKLAIENMSVGTQMFEALANSQIAEELKELILIKLLGFFTGSSGIDFETENVNRFKKLKRFSANLRTASGRLGQISAKGPEDSEFEDLFLGRTPATKAQKG